ncbi:MAG: aspartyl protease family protein [Candidatus Aminicenantes bacterium]|nr:aspartyl protease family protein [Candidatus Aminicenantes bacterium]
MKAGKWLCFGLILSVILFIFKGCTMMKMGSLFLAGHLENKGFYTEIDFQFRRGLILVPVQINNGQETYNFIFDTGAAFNVVSTAITQKYVVASKAADSFTDSTKKSEKIKFTKIERMTIGGIPFERTAAAIFDLDRSPAIRCYHADGAIGVNLMRLVPYWHIDYARKKLIFTDQVDRLPRSAISVNLPFKQNIQRIPIMTMEWNGLRLPFEVDLGSTYGFNAPLEYWEKMRSRQMDIPAVTGHGEFSGGALGKKTYQYHSAAIINNIRVGNYRAPSLLITFMQETNASAGNDFFRYFAMTIDWPKKEIILTPQVPVERPILKTFGFGFSFNEQEQYLYVNNLYEKSPAEAAGLKIGDRILQINDLKLDALPLDGYCRFFLQPELFYGEGDVLVLKIRREGKDQTYTLRKETLLQ